ncbi:hypothetical protein SKAU_G00305500 [Synaphobranchus kaupii]|uniref:Uncharacterized protein n=1 Tax=Synaphobranchus kaupii TaxID=118154 RepID=A0A9Q1EQM1_SYNKA|nr:hypothetical protein SKAU_G00305500 [Synaphobranchus kaupii]
MTGAVVDSENREPPWGQTDPCPENPREGGDPRRRPEKGGTPPPGKVQTSSRGQLVQISLHNRENQQDQPWRAAQTQGRGQAGRGGARGQDWVPDEQGRAGGWGPREGDVPVTWGARPGLKRVQASRECSDAAAPGLPGPAEQPCILSQAREERRP